MILNNFTTIDSIYGRMIVNRHCSHHAEYLIKTGMPHIQEELRKLLDIAATLSPECIVVDAGANIGLVSIPIAGAIKEKKGIVYSFEVQRMLFYALCGSAALNDLDNLKVFNKGVGARKETLKLPAVNYASPNDYGQITLTDQDKIDSTDSVEIITIDSLKLPRLDLLKIDVEGMEIDVLLGAQESIKKFRPWCWIEYWKVDKDLLKGQFTGLNYKLFVMDNLNMIGIPEEVFEKIQIKITAPEF